MKFLLLLFLLASCVSVPLTEEQIEEREYYEQERVLAYEQWKSNCTSGGKMIFGKNPWKLCRSGDCIPSKWDWRYDFDKERPMVGNAYQCVTRSQMREILRQSGR